VAACRAEAVASTTSVMPWLISEVPRAALLRSPVTPLVVPLCSSTAEAMVFW
jgi:hypothetical protein